jgi:hypothetical protein
MENVIQFDFAVKRLIETKAIDGSKPWDHQKTWDHFRAVAHKMRLFRERQQKRTKKSEAV